MNLDILVCLGKVGKTTSQLESFLDMFWIMSFHLRVKTLLYNETVMTIAHDVLVIHFFSHPKSLIETHLIHL